MTEKDKLELLSYLLSGSLEVINGLVNVIGVDCDYLDRLEATDLVGEAWSKFVTNVAEVYGFEFDAPTGG